jgi:hypothetical protein
MALALRSCTSLPLQLLRYASSHSHLGALYHRRLPSARLQLRAAASSYKDAAGNDGIIAAATTCAPVEVDAAAAAEQLGKARRGALPCYPDEGRHNPPKEGNRRDIMSNPSPPGPPVEGSGGNGGAHH